jgi:enoyl-CoA hydratase/carnithine racemase
MRKAANYTEEENYQDALKLAALFHSISHCRAFVIARVHGAAYGGGSGLVAAADLAIASPETMFAFSEVKLGLIAGTISPYVIPKIGAGHARALFGTGEAFGTERALRTGLIHEVGDLDELVPAKVKQVLSVGPEAVAESKRLVNAAPLPVEETARRLARARAGAEGKEGVAAFLEKRKAAFVVEP